MPETLLETTEEAEAEAAEDQDGLDDQETYESALTLAQDALRVLLDYDELLEVRLALRARRGELEKHKKKGAVLGVEELDAIRRLRILDGTETEWGLLRLFAEEHTAENRDLFFDQETDELLDEAEDEDEREGDLEDEDDEDDEDIQPDPADAGAVH